MPTGYWFLLFGLLSFAAMGIIHKLGDRHACNALHIALFTMATSCVLSLIYAAVGERASLMSWKVAVPSIAIPFGACAGAALWFFQRGLRFGRIATSWLLINLSSGVPTVLSVVVYREPLNRKKLIVLLLIAVSLILLWWDRRQDRGKGDELSTVAIPVAEAES
ncbi:MAG: hypothetical protein U0Q18_23875 [Bryobacteraceae bacterium]